MSKTAVLQVSCDLCDAYDEYEMVRTAQHDYYDACGAKAEAKSLGWHFGDDGSVYCAECWEKDRAPRASRKRAKVVVVPEEQGALL